MIVKTILEQELTLSPSLGKRGTQVPVLLLREGVRG